MILHKLRKFCPKCHSVAIKRVRRGFIKKHIFRQNPRYKCGGCQTVFFTPLLEKDLKKSPKDILKIGVDKHTEYEKIEIIVDKM
jgi:transposase-like protein